MNDRTLLSILSQNVIAVFKHALLQSGMKEMLPVVKSQKRNCASFEEQQP